MMEGTMGHRRTGLTRAKAIERLAMWLGLPLLLLLLSLTAGIVNYAPVRPTPVESSGEPAPEAAAPARQADPTPTMPLRPDRLVPLEAPGPADPSLDLEVDAEIS